jgi:hypothetical protein
MTSATKIIWAHIASGSVRELFSIRSDIKPSDIFGSALQLVDVTAQSPAVAVGMLATETNGSWTFAAAPPRPTKSATPASVTIFQAKAVLLGKPGAEAGKTLLDDVQAWAIAQGGLLLLAWTEATIVTRDGKFVAEVAKQFGWSSAEQDAMFTAAAAISG